MKCARCAHQWRLLPEDAIEESAEEAGEHEEHAVGSPSQPAEHHEIFARAAAQASPPEHGEQPADWDEAHEDTYQHDQGTPEEQPAQQEPSWASRFSPGFGRAAATTSHSALSSGHEHEDIEDEAPGGSETGPEDDLPSITSWRAGREPFNASISTLSDSSTEDYDRAEEGEADLEADAAAGVDWAREAKDRLSDDKWSDTADLDDRVEVYGGAEARFQKFDEPEEPETEPQPASDAGGSWASRLMRLRQSPFGKRARSEPEDAETEIRQALNSALEQQDDGPGAKSPFHKLTPERFSGQGEPSAASTRDAGTLRFSDHLDRLDEDNRGSSQTERSERFGFGSLGASAQPDDDEGGEEPPFRLTGQQPRAPIFGAARDLDADEVDAQAEGPYGVDRFESDLQGAFGAAKTQGPADPHGEQDRSPYMEAGEDYADLYDDRFEGDTERDPHLALNEDLAALQSELESTDVATYGRDYVVQGGGGLAVVAAWAVFVSVISGVILALITFRQDIMTALPGTVTLYQTLGFDVPHPGVDFADVSYRWRTADGKPMIEVTGQVVNTTGRTVNVPRVLVNVRDAGGGDAVKATATVPARELAPHASASFSLEFLSPPSDVAQIELAFDDNR